MYGKGNIKESTQTGSSPKLRLSALHIILFDKTRIKNIYRPLKAYP